MKLRHAFASDVVINLLLHYENMPIQIYCKFYHQKLKFFRKKKKIFFHLSAHNIDSGHSLEPPRHLLEPPRRGGSN